VSFFRSAGRQSRENDTGHLAAATGTDQQEKRSDEGIARSDVCPDSSVCGRRGLKIGEVHCVPPPVGPTFGLGAVGELLVGGIDEEDETL
jgi:hypothetical protein